MAKHSQTKSWQQPMNCLSVSDHFVELALNGLTNTIKQEYVDVHCRDMICQSLTIKVVSVTMIGKSEKMKMKKNNIYPLKMLKFYPIYLHSYKIISNNT